MNGNVVLVILLALVAFVVATTVKGNERLRRKRAEKLEPMSDTEREAYLANEREVAERHAERQRRASQDWRDELEYGKLNAAMVCPHCGTKGKIRTTAVIRKKGVSGGKATAAVLTAGVSLLAVGLSRKEQETKAHCGNCSNNWIF
jgi:predicted RNA-binding Zn-ribbon protein involved in translation (DUF1610 family)